MPGEGETDAGKPGAARRADNAGLNDKPDLSCYHTFITFSAYVMPGRAVMRCYRKHWGSFRDSPVLVRAKGVLSLTQQLALHTAAASALEYGLIVSMIAVLIAIVVTSFDLGQLNAIFGTVVAKL